jgi:hypothetical protein
MKAKRELSRVAVARRLQDEALPIAAEEPVRVGGVAVRVPDRVVIEEALETKPGETELELELELKWPADPAEPPAKSARRAASRRGKRRRP